MANEPKSNGLFEGPYWELYKDHLVSREAAGGKVSEDSLRHFNQLGYIGIYQMGVQALEDVGYLKPGSYKKMREKGLSQRALLQNPSNWKEGKNLEWFYEKDNQDAALEKLTRRNYNALSGTFKAQNIDSVPDIYGYLTSAHLGGAGTVKKYIITGDSDFKDANGTSVESYRESFLNAYNSQYGEDTPKKIDIGKQGIEQVKDNIPTIRSYNTPKNRSRIMSNIDFSQSTIKARQYDRMERWIGESLEGGVTTKATSPEEIIARSAFNKQNLAELEEEEVQPVLEGSTTNTVPDIPELNIIPQEQNQQYDGGLQPNGRVSQFTREEDLRAQGNTYNPLNIF